MSIAFVLFEDFRGNYLSPQVGKNMIYMEEKK